MPGKVSTKRPFQITLHMLKRIFLTTGYKFAVFMGLAVFLLLIILRYAFPDNQPWGVYMVSSMLVYSALLVFAIHSFKKQSGLDEFRLPVAFLAGAVPVFLATFISATLIFVFLYYNPNTVELFKSQMIPTPEQAEQADMNYDEVIAGIEALKAQDFARSEISRKLPVLFFVNLLAAMYFRSSAQK